MSKKEIKLGFEIGTGKEVYIPKSHLIVTGITNLSGKTTALMTIVRNGNLKSIFFKTKVGERAISQGTVIPPFYKVQKWGWEYLLDLLEAERKEKLKLHRSAVMDIADASTDLLSARNLIDECLASEKTPKGKKMNAFTMSIYTELKNFLGNVIPYFQSIAFSNTLDVKEGINVIDLERYSDEVQFLVIRSVLEEVLKNHKDTCVVLPELWKMLPQRSNTPCKRPAESFIRQGATNGNYLLMDSQELSGVDKLHLKQVSTWLLGFQQERNEVKHVLDQIPMSKKSKPTPEEIMKLRTGEFYVATRDFVKKVYVCPIWLEEAVAKKIAKGKTDIESIKEPKELVPFSIQPQKPQLMQPDFESQKMYAKVQQDLVELRQDFFNKIQQQQDYITKIGEEVFKLQSSKQDINTDEIVSKVLQKVSIPAFNKEEIITEVLSKVPRISGAVTYEVAPLEKIQKEFLEEAKNKVIADIGTLNDDEKKVLKYIESRGQGIKAYEIVTKCFHLKIGGSANTKVSKITSNLKCLELLRKDASGTSYPRLKERIKELLEVHNATEQEKDAVYNHVLNELL